MDANTKEKRKKISRQYRWKKILNLVIGFTIPQRLFRIYLVLIFFGACLLYMPISLQNGYQMFDWNSKISIGKYTFWDALFISASSLSTTGLTPCEISETLTIFGQVVVMVLIELGGIGILTIFFLIWNSFRSKKNKSISQIIILQSERGNEKIGSTLPSIRTSVIVILIVEAFFTLIYSFWLCWYPNTFEQAISYGIGGISHNTDTHINTYHNYGRALFQGLFCSISAINNAGFTIFHKIMSLDAFRNDGNAFFTFLITCELIIGGIGYPLIFDLIEKVKHKRKHLRYKLSLFTKVALTGFICVTVIGLGCSFGFEYGYKDYVFYDPIYEHFSHKDIAHFVTTENKEFGFAEQFNKAWTIFFNTMSTRSAGFQTIDQNILSPGSKFTFIILMFIGGSPSSTAGGIRTTTLMVIIATILANIRGKKDVVMFNKRITNQGVRNSLLVVIVGLILIALASIVIFYTLSDDSSTQHDKFSVINAFYETASAFGTVGLSMGITQSISNFGLVVLILMMFIGQLGVSTTLLSWTKRDPKGNLVSYPIEDLRIG